MICSKCKKTIPDDAVICCYCGKKLIRASKKGIHQRPNGTGTAFRRGNTWTAKITIGWKVDDNGKSLLISKTKGGFKTKTEALNYVPVLKKQFEDMPVIKLAPTVRHYWDMLEKGELTKISKDRAKAYQIAWRKMHDIADRPINTVMINDLRSVVYDNTSSYYPARDMKTVLNKIFFMAAAEGWVNKDLPAFIILPPLNEKERTPFTKEEQKMLWVAYENGCLDAAFALIMIHTGMMPGELQQITASMIDFENHIICGAGLKTDIRRETPIVIPDCLVPVLMDIINQVGAHENEPIIGVKKHAFYDHYYHGLEVAGTRKLEPYSCRHTMATALAIDENIAPQTVMKVMRWKSTKMLDRYAHPNLLDAQEAVNQVKHIYTTG